MGPNPVKHSKKPDIKIFVEAIEGLPDRCRVVAQYDRLMKSTGFSDAEARKMAQATLEDVMQPLIASHSSFMDLGVGQEHHENDRHSISKTVSLGDKTIEVVAERVKKIRHRHLATEPTPARTPLERVIDAALKRENRGGGRNS